MEEYLRTGTINQAICEPMRERESGYGFDVSETVFSGQFPSWQAAKRRITAQLKNHGSFVIVEATRTEAQKKKYNLTPWHYFSVVNVKNKLFAVDAFNRGQVNGDLDAYADSLHAKTYKLVVGEFRIKRVR